ncbi:efflux RND transporter periplasmic adaptor subunit [Jiella marina]|uniref:efflux RND transporter periplasmic adaptor subunit n=1 Tax=Jiella sp. LLJ827 TaxID=2917712 RepID=UPI002100F25C|nr:efflux RND transporter periplasmic adaptor subunit [Jiella sp. LLJ827]MCQ0988418.1 efflux RND transporter periplasmic adaptor subunit [Jiella sp. LLJ827]
MPYSYRRPFSNFLLGLAVAASAALCLPALAVAQEEGEAVAATSTSPRPPSISVVPARQGQIVEKVNVTGNLTPRETISIGADVEGLRIIELLADEGDTVEAGEVLARLDGDMVDSNLELNAAQIARADAAIAQAESQIADAEANATQAEAALERSRPLAQKGIIGQDVLDQRVAAASSARARLNSARQGLAVAQADKSARMAERDQWLLRKTKTEIKAPQGGLVLSRNARLGAIVSAGSGSLFEIARDGLIELEAEVSETMLGRLRKGQMVAVDVAGRSKPVEGTVRLISPMVDQATRLGTVRVALPKEAEGLRVGAFARGIIDVAESEGVIVPRTAVVFEGDDAVVQVVKEGKVERRQVSLGLTTAASVEIRDGVAAGEDVVAVAGAFVRDGDAVTPVEMSEDERQG